jgi:hypothetical protein
MIKANKTKGQKGRVHRVAWGLPQSRKQKATTSQKTKNKKTKQTSNNDQALHFPTYITSRGGHRQCIKINKTKTQGEKWRGCMKRRGV